MEKGKTLSQLTEASSILDNDLLLVESANVSKKMKWRTFYNTIKSQLVSWINSLTFSVTTTSKTLPGAINELDKDVGAINSSLAVTVVSNTNGTAWKYADGRLEQFGNVEISYSNDYILQKEFQLPVAFKDNDWCPTVSRGTYGNTSAVLKLVPTVEKTGLQSITIGLQNADGSFDNGDIHYLYYHAFGRWK